jgi:hypothetical protein
MRKNDVPQDAALFGRWREIAYAVDEDGEMVLVPCAGWDPANVANLQAWEVIAEAVAEALRGIEAGEKSPLAFHMAVNQMDVALLADYVGMARWRVRRHLRPGVFRRLKPALRERYAAVFRIAPGELERVPARPQLPVETDTFGKDVKEA